MLWEYYLVSAFKLIWCILVAAVVMPSGKTAYPKIEDNRDGTVTVRYQPVETGLHELHVKYNNEPIDGMSSQTCWIVFGLFHLYWYVILLSPGFYHLLFFVSLPLMVHHLKIIVFFPFIVFLALMIHNQQITYLVIYLYLALIVHHQQIGFI